MQKITDQQYLTKDQYKDSSNLDARITIHQRFSTNPQGWFDWVFDELVKLPADATILELGCGTGEMWKQCVARIPTGWNVTLTDLSDGMLDSAWRNLVVTGRGFKFEKMDAQSIPYASQVFDVVIANHMLYHVPDIKKALTEIKRVLKAGGSLIATTVGEKHLYEISAWIKNASRNKYDELTPSFTLENGKSQIAEFFPCVGMSRYPDNLNVTEVAPLMAYLRSGIRAENLDEDEFKKMENELSVALAKDGKIFITKDSGLFIARK